MERWEKSGEDGTFMDGKRFLFATTPITNSSPGSSNLEVTLLYFFSMNFLMMVSMNRFLITSIITPECVLLFRVISTITCQQVLHVVYDLPGLLSFVLEMTTKFNFFAVLLLIKVPMLPGSTMALTMFPFILHLVKVISFVFILSHARLEESVLYSVADTKDLPFSQCPFFLSSFCNWHYELDIGDADDIGFHRRSKSP